MRFESLSRATVNVVLALWACPFHAATYRGLRAVLGVQTDSGVRKAVRTAALVGLVQIIQTPRGRGSLAVVRLSTKGFHAIEAMGLVKKGDN